MFLQAYGFHSDFIFILSIIYIDRITHTVSNRNMLIYKYVSKSNEKLSPAEKDTLIKIGKQPFKGELLKSTQNLQKYLKDHFF